MLAAWVLEQPGKLDERELRQVLSSNLCRCTGYTNIIKAIAAAAKAMGKWTDQASALVHGGRCRDAGSAPPCSKIHLPSMRRVFSVCCGASRTGQVNQILIDRSQFLIIHFPNGTPRHLYAEFMAGGIGPGAHGGYELLQLPFLHDVQVGSWRRQLAFGPAGQIGAVAFAAILICQDVFAIFPGRAFPRFPGEPGPYP